jgi:hypothetical protein
MAPYDDWNRVDDEEDDELQDLSVGGFLVDLQFSLNTSCSVL